MAVLHPLVQIVPRLHQLRECDVLQLKLHGEEPLRLEMRFVRHLEFKQLLNPFL